MIFLKVALWGLAADLAIGILLWAFVGKVIL